MLAGCSLAVGWQSASALGVRSATSPDTPAVQRACNAREFCALGGQCSRQPWSHVSLCSLIVVWHTATYRMVLR